jgi:HEAT repeat protein/beta-lactamase regulating signal transducer with metallopeptidase domain
MPGFLALAVEIAVKSCVVLSIILMLNWFLRRSSAATRHLYLSIGAVALLALPIVSLIIPSWRVGALTNPFVSVQPVESVALAESMDSEALQSSSGLSLTQRSPVGAIQDESSTVLRSRIGEPFRWIILLWGAGGLALLIRLISGRVYGYWISAKAPASKDERLLDLADRVSQRLGLARAIPLVESDRLSVPIVSGSFRSRLIVPSEARDWSSERVEAVLHHEFAHIKRRDILVQLLAQLACCLYWLNPLVWILERRMFIERERACDDIAVGQRLKASDYAGFLMEVMEQLGTAQKHTWVMSAMAEGTDFKDRILSLLDPAANRTVPKVRYAGTVIVFSICLLIPLSALRPWATDGAAVRSQLVPVLLVSDKTNDTETVSRLPGGRDDLIQADTDEQTRILIDVLRSANADMREHAATALAKKGAIEAVPALVDAVCHDPNPSVREHAASALGRLGDTRATPALVEALDDGDPSVREHVATALGKLGDQQALGALTKVLRVDSNARVREHAASAIGKIGSNDAYHALVESYSKDRDIRVKAHAAYGLGLSRDLRALDLLLEGMTSRHAVVRSHCAEALGLLGDPRGLEHLRAALRDPDSSVRASAQHALDMMTW